MMSEKLLTHNCRKCSDKQRMLCIDKAPVSPDDKLRLWQAFIAHKDTEEIQRLLQLQCALDQKAAEQQWEELPISQAQGKQEEKQLPLSTRREKDISLYTRPLRIGDKEAMATKPIKTKQPAGPGDDLGQGEPEEREGEEELPAPSFMLVVLSTGHRITLPAQGTMTMGRVDFDLGSLPDVDLTNDAKKQRSSISRFHAKISLEKGRYYIEDMGSTNGTMVNGRPLSLGQRAAIHAGDRISLGLCEMMCYATPRWLSNEVGQHSRAYLMVTFNGYRYYLPAKREIILGRSEPEKGRTVDIDLGQQDKVASVVSRRHARLVRQPGLDLLEDLGSTYGTKLNGTPVKSELVPLTPGDHIWLGGCVLCYDQEAPSLVREDTPATPR
jgi:pSer/pThr/pTyr-binding forkhead associated (FHA) protein